MSEIYWYLIILIKLVSFYYYYHIILWDHVEVPGLQPIGKWGQLKSVPVLTFISRFTHFRYLKLLCLIPKSCDLVALL